MDQITSYVLTFLLLAMACVGCQGFEWTSDVPDHSLLYTCEDNSLDIPWSYTTTARESILSVQWFFHGHSQQLIAIYSPPYFSPMPAFSNRVQRHDTSRAGLSLSDVTTADTGNYWVKVSGHLASGAVFTYNRTVVVHVLVNDTLMTTDGELHAMLEPQAIYSNTTGQWSLVVSCGHFTFPGDPPFNMEWTTPSTVAPLHNSTAYKDGYFQLHVTSGGDYTCTIPQHAAADLCLHNGTRHATVHVDKMEARMTLMEARQQQLEKENEQLTLKTEELEKENEELRAMQSQLQQENEALKNMTDTLNSKRCETGKVDLYPVRQPVTNETINGTLFSLHRHTEHVTFYSAFSSQPWVSVSLAKLDSDFEHNVRVNSGTSNVTTSGFDVFVYGWYDTILYRGSVSWIACN